MHDDFEKNISRRVKELHIQPQPEVWQRVEAALPPRKRRRRLAFWWLPLLCCLGIGIGLITGNKKNVSKGKTGTGLPVTHTTKSPDPAGKPETSSSPKNDTTGTVLVSSSGQHVGIREKPSDNARMVTIQPAAIQPEPAKASFTAGINRLVALRPGNSTMPVEASVPVPKKDIVKEDEVSAESEAGQAESEQKPVHENIGGDGFLFLSKENDTLVLPHTDSVAKPLVNPVYGLLKQPNDTVPLPQDHATAEEPLHRKKNSLPGSKHKAEWMVTAAAGKSWLADTRSGNHLQYAASTVYNTSAGSPVSTAGSLPFVHPGGSYSLAAGITRRQLLSHRWNWQVALNYQLLQSSQLTGSRKADSSSTGNLQQSNAEVYATGTVATHHNRTHLLQLAPGIGYTFNPAARSPVSFFAGASVAYRLSSNLLLHDYRNRSYMLSGLYSGKWMGSAETGISIFWGQKIHAGLLYEYGFTNVAKPALQSMFHWRQLQLQIGIPFVHHSKK